MKHRILTFAALSLLAGSAHAQTYNPSPTDFYMVGGLSINFADGKTEFPSSATTTFDTEYGSGLGANFGVGMRFNKYLRSDVQLGYMFTRYDIENARVGGVPTGIAFDDGNPYTDLATLMVNGYVDVPFSLTHHVHDNKGGYTSEVDDNTWGWYGGGGVGGYLTDDNSGGAFQLMTGLSFRANDRMVVDAGYKYFSTDGNLEEGNIEFVNPVTGTRTRPQFEVDYDSHIIETGVRYQF